MLYIGRGVRACVGASAQRASGPQDVPRRGGGAVDVQEGEGGSKRAERGAAVVHREAQSQQEYHNVGSPRRDAMRCDAHSALAPRRFRCVPSSAARIRPAARKKASKRVCAPPTPAATAIARRTRVRAPSRARGAHRKGKQRGEVEGVWRRALELRPRRPVLF